MTFQLVCSANGQGLDEAIQATRDFVQILKYLPFRPAEALRHVTAHGSPLVHAEAVALGAALACWVLYLLTRNCSHVDRLWSILPPIYVTIFAWKDIAVAVAAARTAISSINAAGGFIRSVSSAVTDSGANPRLLLAALLGTAWGCRLTYNFWRRGGYNLRFEDYRWPEVRKTMHPVLFELFNLVFVAFAQHILCLLITLPAFVAATVGAQPPTLGAADWAGAAAFVLFLAGETVADQEQWAFQRRKHELIAKRQPRSGDFKRGFRTSGLFRFSRHPNFFCAVGLTVLFHAGSLWITERISAAKYPAYASYQTTTSAITPSWPGPRLPDEGSD